MRCHICKKETKALYGVLLFVSPFVCATCFGIDNGPVYVGGETWLQKAWREFIYG
jgi:hypothetical protein